MQPRWDYNRRTALFAEAVEFDFLLAGARWTMQVAAQTVKYRLPAMFHF